MRVQRRSLASRLIVVTAVAALALVGCATSGDTLGGNPKPEASTPLPTMIILDASGSMTTPDAPGPRIDAAKNVVSTLVQGLSDDSQIGLTVYGNSTGSTDEEKAADCLDITTLLRGRDSRLRFGDVQGNTGIPLDLMV